MNVWDLTCGERIVQLIGHSDGASCVDISGDGQKLWTGGLDNTVRCWDIGARQQLESYMLESQVRDNKKFFFVKLALEFMKHFRASEKHGEKYFRSFLKF